jgi:hypothetical protein
MLNLEQLATRYVKEFTEAEKQAVIDDFSARRAVGFQEQLQWRAEHHGRHHKSEV